MAVSSVAGLILELDQHRKDLNRATTRQLDSVSKREELRSFAASYFEYVRPHVATPSEHLEAVDSAFKELLQLCHKRAATTKYLDVLRRAKKGLITLDAEQIIGFGATGAPLERNPIDSQILITLRALLPTAAMSYEQALIDLAQDSRLSWRGPATDLREAVRETLDHLAPDADVEEMPGFKLVKGTRRPTMKQKVRYILRNRGVSKTLAAPTEHASDAIEEAIGGFVRSVYNRSSVSTHTPTERDEVIRVLDFVRVVMCELLEIRP